MSAEVLRQAAVLMRERAADATASPWEGPDHLGVIRAGFGSKDDGTLVHGEDCGCGGGIGYEPDAIHIASWHPAVALAVADWLDHAAATPNYSRERHSLKHVDAALAVARTYLGESA